MRGLLAICMVLYGAGLVLYSALFIYSANQSDLTQTVKILVAGTHWLVLLVPVYLVQSPHVAVRILGYAIIVACFVYAVFLVGFVPYFGFVPELYAHDTRALVDLSAVIDHYFAQLFGWREVLLIALCGVLLWLARRVRLPDFGLLALAAPAALASLSIHAFGLPSDNSAFGNLTIMRRFGPVGFGYSSLEGWRGNTGGYLAAETAYPGRIVDLAHREKSEAAPFVPKLPSVSRVILLQIESFDPQAIEARIAGQSVMPFVSALKKTCLNYTNFFTMKGAGGSSDSEFAVVTGLVPSIRMAALKHTDFSRVETLYDILSREGVASRFSHNNQAGFYGRHIAYAQLPEVTADFQAPADQTSEPDFADMTLKASLDEGPRVFHYFFNFQSHGPYEGYSEATRTKLAIPDGADIRMNYMATMSEIDDMIARLFRRQAAGYEAGENLFILTADHPSQLYSGGDVLSRSRIPALICHADFEGRDVPNVFGSADLFPTILEAFGLAGRDGLVGQSMFWDADNAVLLPRGEVIARQPDGEVAARRCGPACDPFFAYTEQHIRLGK